MTKHLLGSLSFAVVSMIALSQPAKADQIISEDPLFMETLTNSCPANCGSVALASDPLSGKTTVEYIFNSTIPTVVPGDVKIQELGSSTIGDLIRFENINGVAVAFVFSNDISAGLAADVGLPASFQNDVVTISEASNDIAMITPTSSQPGFCTATSCSAKTYGLESPDSIPEPASLALFGTALAGLGFLRRRKR